MRKISLKILMAMMVIGLAASAAGCGAPVLVRPSRSPDAQTVKITGSCEISVLNNTVTVSGENNIMNGALIQIAVVGQDGLTLDSAIIKKSSDQISHSFGITDKYNGVKSIIGFITCAPSHYGTQPDEVYKSYGHKFENIDAAEENYIWDGAGNIIIFRSKETVDLPAQ